MKKILIALLFSLSLEAATYTLPDDLPSLGCSLWFGSTYNCGPLSFGNWDVINVNSDVSINTGASVSIAQQVTIATSGNTLNFVVGGTFTASQRFSATTCVNVEAGGDITIGNQSAIEGNLQSNGGTVSLGKNTTNTPCAASAPTAVDDDVSTNVGTAVDIDVTINDTNGAGIIDKTTVVAQQGNNGTTSVNSTTGVVTYTPNLAFTGTDTFTYTVDDDAGRTSNSATVTVTVSSGCSPQMGEGTINEIFKVGNQNFFEVKIFDPAATDYSDWSLLYCAEGAEIGSCVKFLDVTDLTQTNIYWFLAENIPGFDDLNSNSQFTLFMVDVNGDPIDMLSLNGAVLGPNTDVDCTFLYDTTAETTSSSKAIARNPDGTGDWGDSGGAGSPTENTPGDNNNGTPTSVSSEYKMDECLWDGTTDEVLDSSGNGFHGKAVNGPYTDSWGQIERGGYFDGVDDYVEQDDIYDNLKGTASLSFWIKTTQASPFANAQRSPGVIGIEDNGGVDDIFWGWIDNNGHINLQKGNNLGPKSLNPINDNTWHHVVFTRDHISQVCNIYVDGVLNDTDTSAPGIVGNSFNRIGSNLDTDGTHTYFNGYLDELKTFSSILSASEVQTIYTNELAKNNYDGSVRAPIICPNQILAEYRMDECVWAGLTDEVVDSSGNNYHATAINGSITESAADSGGGSCIGGRFDGIDDYLEIGQFPDVVDDFSITAWFKTSNRSKTGQIIFADDDNSLNGYAISMGDGGIGRVRFYDKSQTNDGVIDTGNKVQNNTWYFVTAVNDKQTALRHLYLYNAAGTQLDHRTLAITANRGLNSGLASIGGDVNNHFVGNVDEVKVFTKALTQTDLESILNNEVSGLNWDGSARTCQPCTGLTPKDGNYTAVDFVSAGCSAQVNWNDNLQTKIVNNDINLSILAIDKDTGLSLEANITKVSLVHYPSGNNNSCTGTALSSVDVCTNCGLTDVDGCLALSVSKSFNQRASQCVEIVVQGKDKDDTNGASLSDSNSSDNLAIRPDTYNCDGIGPSVLVSERIYASTFDALPLNLSTPTLGYTTNSVSITANKYTRLGDLNNSLSGVFSPSTLSFVDGNASTNLFFNDVGDIGVDLNDSTWAEVDSDDTSEADRVVHKECRLLFIPDHFEVVLNKPLLENNSTFTYLSNDLNMSAWIRNLDVTITAQGEANGVMQNYTYPINTYYANQVTLLPSLSLPSHGATSALQGSELNDENSTDIIGFEFINGVASYSYEDIRFNYPRDFSSPVPPFQIDGNLTDFSLVVQDNLYPSVDGNDSTDADGNATFYYGRLHPSDLVASAVPQTNTIPFEVYDETGSSFVSGMKQTSLSWYINGLHIDNSVGDIIEANASRTTIMGNLAGFSFTYIPVSVGEQDLNIATVGSEEKSVIHLKTQEWLWYVPASFGSAYDDSAGSDCTMHPCFKLSIDPVNTPSFIQSGSFEGAEIPDVNRSDYFQKGIKLFR